MNDPAEDSGAGPYPIRTVAAITGVNPVTLRAWERRYGLIQPRRTPKGHRLYSREQIVRIQRVLQLLDEGIPISQARQLLDAQPAPVQTRGPGDPWPAYINQMLRAVERFDETALETTYNDALALYPVELVTHRLVVPLLESLGERWQQQAGAIAEEHFFATYLRNKLGARFHHQMLRTGGPKFIAACLPGERHEAGLLLFCLVALNHGLRPVMLGADMPLTALASAVERSGSRAVVLSGAVTPPAGVLEQDLPALVSATNAPVFVGGAVSGTHRTLIESAGAAPLPENTTEALARLTDVLRGRTRTPTRPAGLPE